MNNTTATANTPRMLHAIAKWLKLRHVRQVAMFHLNDEVCSATQAKSDAVVRELFKLADNRYFGISLHRIRGREAEQYHDHPWPVLSLVLYGHYQERRFGEGLEPTERTVKWGNRIGPSDFHMIVDAKPNTWLLVFRGRQVKARGYLTGLHEGQASYVTPTPFSVATEAEPNKHIV